MTLSRAADELVSLLTRAAEHFERGRASRDGDGDGFVGDGTPQQRPVLPGMPDRPRRPRAVRMLPEARSRRAQSVASVFGNQDAGDRLRQWRAAVDGPYPVRAGKGARPGPYSVRTEKVEFSPGRMWAEGTIADATGAPVGRFSRLIKMDSDGELFAKHEDLEMDPGAQGHGFATAFNANLYDWYRRSGVRYVKAWADASVGSYTWASDGYDFDDEAEASRWVRVARRKIDAAKARPDLVPLTADQLAALDRYIADIDAGRVVARALDISQFGRRPRQRSRRAMWPGKWLMLKARPTGPYDGAEDLYLSMDWWGTYHLS